jgi:SAM-dependent methyltransferase
LRKHATGGWLHGHSGPGGAAERYGDADSWSAGAGIEDFVRSQLPPPPARVLEVGCGSGALALALSGGGWRVTAVDPEAPDGEPFVRAAVEELDAAEYEPFDAAVAVLSLHHAGNVGLVLDKVRSLLKPGGVFVVDEFRKEHLADEATAAFYYHQRLSLLHAGRKETGGGGHQPSGGHLPGGGSFESWYARVSEHRAGVHDEGKVLAALEERFATRSLSFGPFMFRQGLDPEVEPLERKLMEEGGIRPTGLRWVGVLGAESGG